MCSHEDASLARNNSGAAEIRKLYNTKHPVYACKDLSQQISETDKEIDTLVFDLYGLTPEEREIVMKG